MNNFNFPDIEYYDIMEDTYCTYLCCPLLDGKWVELKKEIYTDIWTFGVLLTAPDKNGDYEEISISEEEKEAWINYLTNHKKIRLELLFL